MLSLRTFRPSDLILATEQMGDNLHGFYPEEWLADKKNIALVNDKGDVALLECLNGIYTGHYFFFSRGRDAVEAAKDFLKEAFIVYDIKVIRGLTPVEKKGAWWLTKHLGFKDYGLVDTSFGTCHLSILTKEEWLAATREE